MINSQKIPLSLYIHVPWCEKKCPYCDFNSHDNQQHFDESAYVDALLKDLDADLQLFQDAQEKSIHSIFIGGGTPSLFSATAYKTLLTGIAERLDITTAEITLEANPGSSEQAKFAGYLDAGINRLSIGTQSYNPDMLARIGRVHNQQEAMDAAKSAQTAGFQSLNLDIMFALPKQTLEQAIDDIETAISFNPQHLSCYQLTLEPNTLFYQQKPQLPSNDTAWAMQEALQTRLNSAGYQQYEVSAYAQESKQCQHNLNYWQFGDYLGIGAGAHGKITRPAGDIQRYWKQKQPKQYMQTAASKTELENRIGGHSTLETKTLAFEFMLNALRLKNGFSVALFTQRTGLGYEQIEPLLNKHAQAGLLAFDTQNTSHITPNIIPTTKGYQFIDSMLNDYLP